MSITPLPSATMSGQHAHAPHRVWKLRQASYVYTKALGTRAWCKLVKERHSLLSTIVLHQARHVPQSHLRTNSDAHRIACIATFKRYNPIKKSGRRWDGITRLSRRSPREPNGHASHALSGSWFFVDSNICASGGISCHLPTPLEYAVNPSTAAADLDSDSATESAHHCMSWQYITPHARNHVCADKSRVLCRSGYFLDNVWYIFIRTQYIATRTVLLE